LMLSFHETQERSSYRPMPEVDFDHAPFLLIWETTQACDLVCIHCRASAQPSRDPSELSTREGFTLIDETSAMGTPLIIFSGGDPVNRPDLLDLIRHAKEKRLRVATIPAATDKLTRPLVRQLKEAGLDQMALSLDLPDADRHDAFRGAPNAYAKTMRAIEWAHSENLPLQINTTLSGTTAPFFASMTDFVRRLGIVFWEVFFLVPTGRGALLPGLSPEECERLFEQIHAVQKNESFIVKVTEAPHYRRYVAQRENSRQTSLGATVSMPRSLTRSEGPGHTVGLAPRGVNAGNGFMFVSHTGEAYPSGFLPLSAGNVRGESPAEIYRRSPLFQNLRDPEVLKGRCGRCEYRVICGGSRSRAFALTGDPLAADPWCGYEPAGEKQSHLVDTIRGESESASDPVLRREQ
jgi:radical SAM protein